MLVDIVIVPELRPPANSSIPATSGVPPSRRYLRWSATTGRIRDAPSRFLSRPGTRDLSSTSDLHDGRLATSELLFQLTHPTENGVHGVLSTDNDPGSHL